MKVELRGFYVQKKNFFGNPKMVCQKKVLMNKAIDSCLYILDELGIAKDSVIEVFASECFCAHNEHLVPYAIVTCEEKEAKHVNRIVSLLVRLGLDVEEPVYLRKFHDAGAGTS